MSCVSELVVATFSKFPLQASTRVPVILIEGYCGSPQFLQVDSGIMPRLGLINFFQIFSTPKITNNPVTRYYIMWIPAMS
jgi:hypothetical protein